MKTVTTVATVGLLFLLLLASPSAQAQNSQAGPSSVGVSNITLVLHPRLRVERAAETPQSSTPPLAVTSNFQGGYEVQRIDLRQIDSLQGRSGAKRSRQSNRKQFAYVVVPKPE